LSCSIFNNSSLSVVFFILIFIGPCFFNKQYSCGRALRKGQEYRIKLRRFYKPVPCSIPNPISTSKLFTAHNITIMLGSTIKLRLAPGTERIPANIVPFFFYLRRAAEPHEQVTRCIFYHQFVKIFRLKVLPRRRDKDVMESWDRAPSIAFLVCLSWATSRPRPPSSDIRNASTVQSFHCVESKEHPGIAVRQAV